MSVKKCNFYQQKKKDCPCPRFLAYNFYPMIGFPHYLFILNIILVKYYNIVDFQDILY